MSLESLHVGVEKPGFFGKTGFLNASGIRPLLAQWAGSAAGMSLLVRL